MISRLGEDILNKALEKYKSIVLYGPRQVWKTTLLRKIEKEYWAYARFLDCDYLSNRELLDITQESQVRDLCEWKKILLIDEAQRVRNIWLTLKIIHDSSYDIQVIATWSSSFWLSQHIAEPMTWRVFQILLFPISLVELKNHFDAVWIKQYMESLLIYWMYPAIVNASTEEKITKLNMISWNYLYKDILELENIKKSSQLEKLLQLLALQVGHEVSYHELGQKLWMSSLTIEKYVRLLEESFIIKKIWAYHKNLRNEITKSQKIYFRDLGIRNSLIQQYWKIWLRSDVWWLWENFVIIERIKKNAYAWKNVQYYFWRTYQQAEIDLIELENGVLSAFEIKYNQKKTAKMPLDFARSYWIDHLNMIHSENYGEFLM